MLSRETKQELIGGLVFTAIILGSAFLFIKSVDWRARSAVLNMVKDSCRK